MTRADRAVGDPALSDLLDRALRQPAEPWASLTLLMALRQVPGRRATFLGAVGDVPVVAKVFSSPRARGNHRRVTALAGAGLHDLVPQSLGVDESGHVGVLTYRSGTVLDAVDDAVFVPACAAAGRSLARLHAADAPLDRAWQHDDEVAQLVRRVPASMLEAAERASALVVGDVPLVCAHRDFHPRQVVVDDATPAQIGFIDLDDAALAPPGLDVGNMVAHLRREAVIGRRSPSVAKAAIKEFLAGYGEPPPDLSSWECLALARLAGLAETRHRRADERDALLALLAGGPATAVAPAPGSRSVGTGHQDRPVVVVTRTSGEQVVLKRYLAADGSAIHELMTELWASPFGADRAPLPGLPEPLGFDAPRGELTMSLVPGEPMGARGDLGLTLQRAEEAAALLADLHASSVVVPRLRRRSGLLKSAARKAAERADTPQGPLFLAAVDAVRSAWGEPSGVAIGVAEPLVVCHGDFSPRNLLCAPGGLVLIDFDRLQMSHPLRDVAYWSAWTWATVTLSGRPATDDAWGLSGEFQAAYAARSGLDLDRLAGELSVHRALALIRIAHGWSSLRTDPDAVQRVLAEATRLAGEVS